MVELFGKYSDSRQRSGEDEQPGLPLVSSVSVSFAVSFPVFLSFLLLVLIEVVNSPTVSSVTP